MLAIDRIPADGLWGMTGLAKTSASWKIRTTSLIPPASTMSGWRMSGSAPSIEVAEVPAMLELLAGRDRDVERPADLAQAGHVVLGERLLEVGQAQPLELATLADRGPHRVAAVGIEPEPDVRPERRPDLARHLEVLGRVDVAADRPPVHPDLERVEALVAPDHDVRDHLLGRLLEARADAPVERDLGPRGAAQQGVDGQAGGLAHEVPQGDVDDAGERGRGRVGEVVGAGRQPLPVAARL